MNLRILLFWFFAFIGTRALPANRIGHHNLPPSLSATAYIGHISTDGMTRLGKIKIFPDGGSPPYTISWSSSDGYPDVSGKTSFTIDSLDTGHYTAIVTDNDGNTFNITCEVSSYIALTHQLGITVSNDTVITKITSTGTYTNAGFGSRYLTSSGETGYLAHRVSSLSERYAFGLTTDPGTFSSGLSGFDYACEVNSDVLNVYHAGSLTYTAPDPLNAGDEIRITREGTGVHVYLNGNEIWSTIFGFLSDCYLKCNMYSAGPISQFYTDFRRPVYIAGQVFDVYCRPGNKGTVKAYTYGGSKPVSMSITGGVGMQPQLQYDSLAAGTYTVYGGDAIGRHTSQEFYVGNCPVWTTTTSSISNDNQTGTLTKSGTTDWFNAYQATSDTFHIVGSQPAWFSFSIVDTVSSFITGFSNRLSDSLTNPANYSLYVEGSQVTVLETDNDGFYNKISLGTVNPGDAIMVLLDSDGIHYYFNNTMWKYTSKLYSSLPLVLQVTMNGSGSIIGSCRVSSYGN